MKKWLRFFSCALILIFTGALGCGSGGGDNNGGGSNPGGGNSGAISGVAFKGPVDSGMIRVLNISLDVSGNKTGNQIGTGMTDLVGNFSFSLSGAGTEIELRLVSGTFTDEVTGESNIAISDQNPLRACIPGFNPGSSLSNIAITPVTTLACEIADYLIDPSKPEEGIGVADAFTQANNNMVSAEVSAEVPSYIVVPNTNFNQLDIIYDLPVPYPLTMPINFNNHSILYTLLIVGLSEEARKISGINIMDFLKGLKRDASDGIFDGAEGVDPITLGVNKELLPIKNKTIDLTSAIQDLLGNIGSALPTTTTTTTPP